MERIDFHGAFFPLHAKSYEKKSSQKKTGRTGRAFADLLRPDTEEADEETVVHDTRAVRQTEQTRIAEALDAVHTRGETLKKTPTLKNADDYKQAVQRFIKLIVASCYELEVSERKHHGELKPDIQIRIIDAKLEKLAAQIMRGQKEELEILRRVDEIYGLLVDLRQ
ncbi:MAG: DUF327 family protein [Spirochaetales bacterium]|jgi:uncharacterized protein YaaR (DUF327 family)|nr:DUF327 family protein [Spirochaetales bacterium]